MYPDLFMNFPRKFEEKILRLKNQLGENYVEIIENDTSVLEKKHYLEGDKYGK